MTSSAEESVVVRSLKNNMLKLPSGCSNEREDFREEVRGFASYNYRELAMDMAVGQGPFLEALKLLIQSESGVVPSNADITVWFQILIQLENTALFANYLAADVGC